MIRKLRKEKERLVGGSKRGRILNNYYSKELNDGKSYKALKTDEFLFRICIFELLAIYLNHKSKTLILSFYFSAISVYYLGRIITGFKKKREDKKKEDLLESVKRRKLLKEINSLNKIDFINYIKSILEKYYCLEISHGKYFDLEYTSGQEKHAIICLKLGMDDRVNIRELETFNWEFKRQGMNTGTLVTNSYFSDEIGEDDSIILYDIDSLILILKELELYPNKEDIENYIIDRYITRRNSRLSGMFELNFRKVLQIYGLFAIFYLMSYFVKYSTYYRVVSILLFSIITIIIGYKLSKKFKEGNYPLNKKNKS